MAVVAAGELEDPVAARERRARAGPRSSPPRCRTRRAAPSRPTAPRRRSPPRARPRASVGAPKRRPALQRPPRPPRASRGRRGRRSAAPSDMHPVDVAAARRRPRSSRRSPRRTKSGSSSPTARIARTGELTPPGMSRSRAARRARTRCRQSHCGELLRPVREDEVGAGALDRGQRLERGLPLVEVARARRRPSPSRTRRRRCTRRPGSRSARARRGSRRGTGSAGLTISTSAPSATSSSHSRSASRTFAGIHLVAAAVAERRRRARPPRGTGRRTRRRTSPSRRRSASPGSASRIAPTRPSIMSLGATASAPASTWLTAVRASSSSVSSLSTSPSRSTPQWPCARVLAEADVGDEHELGELGAQRAQRLLDDPVVVPGARALVVLLLRDAEEQHRLDAEPRRALPPRARARRPSAADRRAAPRSRTRRGRDEERHHEVVEVEPRLAHERRAGRRCAAAGGGAWRGRSSRASRLRQSPLLRQSSTSTSTGLRRRRDARHASTARG